MGDNLHAGHREKLKARFLKNGLDAFEPHNALELLLFYAIPRRDTNELAHRLMKTFGSFAAVLDAPLEQLMEVEGIGQNTAVLLKMIPQLCRMYLDDSNQGGRQLQTSEEIGGYLMPKFVGMTVEGVYLLCMDNRNKILFSQMISTGGTVNASSVTIRVIVEAAVRCQATQVVLAHNHPQGFALPSQQDIAATRAIAQHLRVLGIQLTDHIITAKNDYVSLAQSGILG